MSDLAILGLLKMKPMHGYEIQTIIQQSRMDVWANLLSGSIYYAISKLEKEELIAPLKEERTGSRVRMVYQITKDGEEKYAHLLKETLALQPHSLKSDFNVALAMLDSLPKEDAISILEANIARLENIRSEWEIGKKLKEEASGYNRLTEISFEGAFDILEADIKLMKNAVAYLEQK